MKNFLESNTLSRKKFLIIGFAFIHLSLGIMIALQYFMLSKIIDGTIVSNLTALIVLLLLVGFGVLIWKRLGGMRGKVLILTACLAFYFLMMSPVSDLLTLYSDKIAIDSGAQSRLFVAISQRANPDLYAQPFAFSEQEKWGYILVQLPAHYISYLPFFLILILGSLNLGRLTPNFMTRKSATLNPA